ncbi:MAG: hypothetical protein KGI10_04080 [Thaumarchaeota archaeon]|nr:hypothetical protein [Nitrososphaerota archaeon]
MSSDHGDVGISPLEYLTIQTHLFTNLNLLKQEIMHNANFFNTKGNFDEAKIKRILNNLAVRRNYLLKLASQAFTSEDYAEFKDIVEDSVPTEYRILDRKTKKIVTRNF